MTALTKEYNEDFHQHSRAKRSLDKARHASLKQLSGKQKVDQFAALGAVFAMTSQKVVPNKKRTTLEQPFRRVCKK